MPSADEGCRLLAARYLRKHAKRLAAQIDGARRAEDSESVHQARVASRRLRAGLRMFRGCCDAERPKAWRKQIRRVTTKLGDARDKDVQIAYLCGVLQDLGEKARYPGIVRLLARLEGQRERIQPEVVKAVDRLQASGVLEEIFAATKRVLAQTESQGAGLHGPLVFGQLQRHVLENLDRLLSYQDSLADAEDRERHHAMRIAAKRLRYSLEISAPAYPGQLEVAVEVTRRVQTLLGEVHDCDVWVEELRAFAAKLCKRIRKHFADTGPFARLHVGIEYLQQERRRRRQQAFQELVDYWQELHRRREWQRLADVLKGDRVRPLSDPLPGSQCAAMP